MTLKLKHSIGKGIRGFETITNVELKDESSESDKRELLAISNDGADAKIVKDATGTILKCLQGSCSASAKMRVPQDIKVLETSIIYS